MNAESRLKHYPIAIFSIVMGMAGLTLAWQRTEKIHQLPTTTSDVLAYATAAVFVLIAVPYIVKFLRHPDAVLAELRHPIKINFFPTISVAVLLLAVVALHAYPPAAEPLWMAGTAGHLVLTLYIVHSWFNSSHLKVQHLNPAWFIPAVGNVVVPIAGASLGYTEISWFFFSIGILFWLILVTIIFNRILFHHPIPDRLAPTIFIMIAPPAVGCIAYTVMVQELQPFAHILYYAGLFLTLFLFTQLPRLMRLKFFLSWWAYSFPLAAITIATWIMADLVGEPALQTLAIGLQAILTVAIAALAARTLMAVARGEICQPEG